jgi:cytidine deaminase
MSKSVDPKLADLFDAAKKAQSSAYAPYSHFNVGAALRTPSGAIFSGCNVENAAYPQGACAEGDGLCTPCGGCRQRIREFAAPEAPIHVAGPEGVRSTTSLAELLPYSFGPENLKQ